MSELIGRNLGPYRVVQQLGMGGMATVYQAYQASMDRSVAVKVLPRHFAQDPTFVGRFEQEARVIAKLENARILPVYDYGEDDGITYIVMRYLDAGTLSERIHAGSIPLEETSRILTQIAEGLDYAHKKGVIHRDVKPSNIMLDSNGDVYITDFGISKLVEGNAQFTGSGVVGTPDYISPEQAIGKPIDYRSDIYSLGIVLYQMVTNDVPFHAETPMAVIIKHIHEPLPLPRSLNPDLSESVQNVVLKTLAKNPDDRYQTCGELARAFAGAVAGVEVPVPEGSPAHLPTAMPSSTRPVVPIGDAGTLPIMPPPSANQPTQQAQAQPVPEKKKRSGLATVLTIVGVLAVVIVLGVAGLNIFRTMRERRTESATTTAIAAASTPEAQTAPTDAPTTPAVLATSESGTATGGEGNRTLFEDHFEGDTLRPAWQWINEPAAGDWKLVDGRLGIVLQPTVVVGDPTATSSDLTAPVLALAVPDVPVLVTYFMQVDVMITPTEDYEQAGIIVIDDEGKTWLNLIHGYCSHEPPDCSGSAIYFDDWYFFLDNQGNYRAPQAGGGTLPTDRPVTLRMTIKPKAAIGEFSVDGGSSWQKVGEWTIERRSRIKFLGLVASSDGGSAANIIAHFDNVLVAPQKAQ